MRLRFYSSVFTTLFFVQLLGLNQCLKAQEQAFDTLYYRTSEQLIRIDRERHWVDRIKRKSLDSTLIWLEEGDRLVLQATAKRDLSLNVVGPDRSTLFSSKLGSTRLNTDLQAEKMGFYTVYVSNPSLFLASSLDLLMRRVHIQSICSDFCAEHTHQRRSEPLPKRIETTVSAKKAQQFSLRLQPRDTMSLFMPGKGKIPRIEVWAPNKQRLFTLESGRAPLSLRIPVLDSGLHEIRLSKSGLLGRFPTTHELFVGRIQPAIANDSCCTNMRLVPKKEIQLVVDTLVVAKKDSLITLGALRNIRQAPVFQLDLPEVSEGAISRFLLVAPADSGNAWQEITSRMMNKSLADAAQAMAQFSRVKTEIGNTSSEMRISINIEELGLSRIFQDIECIELPIDQSYRIRFTHKDPIKDSSVQFMVLEFQPVYERTFQ